MFLLEKDSYEKIRPIFNKRLSFEMPVKTVFSKHEGRIYVDDSIDPKAGYIELDYGFYYFCGRYDRRFIDSVVSHILTNIVPKQTIHDYAFIFADSEEIKKEIEQMLEHYKIERGKRCYYKLNVEKFSLETFDLDNVLEQYKFKLDKENLKVTAIYNGVDIGSCSCGGSVDKTMECDVFLENEHRNKGVGTVVCAKFIMYCLSKGYNDITWGCWEANISSCKLAEKLKFEMDYEDTAVICTVK